MGGGDGVIYINQKTGRRIKLAHSGDMLIVSYFRKEEDEPYVSIRTRGQESNEVIADLKKEQTQ